MQVRRIQDDWRNSAVRQREFLLPQHVDEAHREGGRHQRWISGFCLERNCWPPDFRDFFLVGGGQSSLRRHLNCPRGHRIGDRDWPRRTRHCERHQSVLGQQRHPDRVRGRGRFRNRRGVSEALGLPGGCPD